MRGSNSERGVALITVALMLTVLLGFLALVVDVGVGYIERRRVQSVADAASLAGVQRLVNNFNNDVILATVRDYALVKNLPAGNETRPDPTDPVVGGVRWIGGAADGAVVAPGGVPPAGVTGIKVTITGSTPTFFARLLGITTVTSSASGSGGYSPLDVMLVLDRSISMAFYSCNWEPYFANGQHCHDFIPSSATEFQRITAVYYACNGVEPPYDPSYDCRGYWWTPNWYQPYACYWWDETLMTSVPGCAADIATNPTHCVACRGSIVAPLHPMTEAKSAASYFLDLVDAQLAPTYPRMGLVSYSDTGTLDQGLTYSSSQVKVKINQATPGGSTNCEEGLSLARNELATQGRATAVKAIVFLTDGQANLYIGCYDQNYCSASIARSNAIAQATLAKAQGIRIYTIGLGSAADQAMLQQIATDSGGAYLYAPTAADLQAAYAEMFAKIKRLRLVQ